MSIWDKFFRLTHLRIDFPNSVNKTAEIYGNGRNQVEVLITLRIVDENQVPLRLKETDLEEHVYLCDYYTGKRISIPWIIANEDNGYNKVISYHSFSDNENEQAIVDEDGFIRIHKFISCDRQDNGIVISAGIDVPDVGKFNTSMYGTTTRNGPQGKEGKIFKNPQYVNVNAREEIVYSSESEFEFVYSDILDRNVGSDITCYISTIKIRPRSSIGKNNFFKEYFFDQAPVDQNKMDNTGRYFKLFPEGYVTPYSVIGNKSTVVLMYLDHNHIKVDGYFSLYCQNIGTLKYSVSIEIDHTKGIKGKEIILYLYKLTASTNGMCQRSAWSDGPNQLTMKVMDSYGNSGAMTLIFDDKNIAKPKIVLPSIEKLTF